MYIEGEVAAYTGSVRSASDQRGAMRDTEPDAYACVEGQEYLESTLIIDVKEGGSQVA